MTVIRYQNCDPEKEKSQLSTRKRKEIGFLFYYFSISFRFQRRKSECQGRAFFSGKNLWNENPLFCLWNIIFKKEKLRIWSFQRFYISDTLIKTRYRLNQIVCQPSIVLQTYYLILYNYISYVTVITKNHKIVNVRFCKRIVIVFV